MCLRRIPEWNPIYGVAWLDCWFWVQLPLVKVAAFTFSAFFPLSFVQVCSFFVCVSLSLPAFPCAKSNATFSRFWRFSQIGNSRKLTNKSTSLAQADFIRTSKSLNCWKTQPLSGRRRFTSCSMWSKPSLCRWQVIGRSWRTQNVSETQSMHLKQRCAHSVTLDTCVVLSISLWKMRFVRTTTAPLNARAPAPLWTRCMQHSKENARSSFMTTISLVAPEPEENGTEP